MNRLNQLSFITRKVFVRFQAVAAAPSVLLNCAGSISPRSTKGTVAKPAEYPTMKNTRPTTGSQSRPCPGRFKVTEREIAWVGQKLPC